MDQDFISQTVLDQMVGSDNTQILKALIPYLPFRYQEIFSVYAKTRELSNTISLFSPNSSGGQMQAAQMPAADPMELLQNLQKVCGGEMRSKLKDMMQMMAMVQMMQLMNENPTDKQQEDLYG